MAHREPDPDLLALLRVVRPRLEEVVALEAAAIRGTIDMYRDESMVSDEKLAMSLRSSTVRVIDYLEFGGVPDLSVAYQLGRARAAMGVPLSEVLRGYRVAFAAFWEWMLGVARESGERAVGALIDAVGRIWEVNDEYSTSTTLGYRDEKTDQTVALDRRRSALVAGLIDGTLGDQQTTWEIGQLLEMPYGGAFLVVVAEIPQTDVAALPHLEGVLRGYDIKSAWLSQYDREVGIVHRNRTHTAASVLELIEANATSRVGVSPEYTRLDRTSRGAKFASIALEALPAGSTGVKQLPDTPLGELVLSHPDTTRRFVRRVLGGILAMPDDDRSTLLSTAQVWLEAHGSAAEAGRVLYCHENTVRYRMRRVEERLGISLDDPFKHAEFAAAIEAIQLFPDLSKVRLDAERDG
ncbi:PucR family transcriptional regulator [Nocardia macrotermitis]|uniref:PucR family transcriptional regulator n=1 Tax=Nocardia macrotermitis TaxID=2585198 RepID=UPI0012965891|nr:PucR family transcriptional regulator [Nocardia macrotermitis]